jgi:hypothetical protein
MQSDTHSKRYLPSVIVFLAIFALTMTTHPATAGILTLDSQTRYVQITTEGSPLMLPPETHRQDSSDFTPFNASISSSVFQQPLPGILQRISQTSSMTVTSAGATIVDHSAINGSISFNPLPARSFFDVNFSLSQPAPFTLSYVGLYGDARFILNTGVIVNGSFTGPGAPGVLAPADPLTYNRGTPLHFSGTLQPGSFDIQADLNANANAGNIDLTLNIGSATPAIPLPRALFTTLATLPLLALAMRHFRRRASAIKQ